MFSSKVVRGIGSVFAWIFKFLNISYKIGMWTFGILTVLIGYGLFNSIMGVMNLEGLVILPLIGGIIKLLLFVGVLFGWFQFWVYTRTYRRGKDIADTAQTVYDVGKFAMEQGANQLEKRRERQQIQNDSGKVKTNTRGKGKKYFS